MYTEAISRNTASGSESRTQIVLVSGGVESSTLLSQVHATHGEKTLALFFDYGQRAHRQEEEATERQREHLNMVQQVVHADLSNLGNTFRKRQKERKHIPLQHRNAVLLSIATSLAAQEGSDGIWIAICKSDLDWYASASLRFLAAMRDTLQTLQPGLQLHAPYTSLLKEDVVGLGVRQGVCFDTTWSCMLDRQRHCGRCIQCRARKEAFTACGHSEPSHFYER